MTNKEAIEILKQFKKCLADVVFDEKGSEAWQMAIKALSQEPCTDAVSREAVDKYIVELLSGYLYNEERERLEKLSAYLWELPSVNPQPCDDAISREAFIKRYDEWMYSEYGKHCEKDALAIRVANSLPSVTQKSGKWIAVYQGDEIINYRCSECELGDTNGSTNLYGWDYCRRCGAKMESEDKE